MRKVLILLILLTVLSAGLGWALWFFDGEDFSGRKIRNVIVISIDTCRADYLSCYGYRRKTTPNIDELANESVLFYNVISPVPITLPAHSSMLTGTVPPFHGVHDNSDYRLDESRITLAEILKENGFRTGAVVSSFVLDSQFGINQGFDSYHDRFEDETETPGGIAERKGDDTSRLAIQWLDEHKDERFFFFLHYFDPHDKYEPPEPFASKFAPKLYAGEIAFTDHCIGQVIDKLKSLGLYDSTLVIITGDHGEMLGEHGEASHSYFIYQSAIKVPLIFRLPGQRKAKRIDPPVGIIDIVPTVCGLLDIEPPSVLQGIDLSDLLYGRNTEIEPRYLYCESLTPTKYDAGALLGLVTDRYKYIETSRPELYDLDKDPAETNNLVDRNPKIAHMMNENLKLILAEEPGRSDDDNRLELDAEALEKLRGFGYVGGSIDENLEFDHTKDDAKDLLDLHNLHMKAGLLMFTKQYDQAEVVCKEMLLQKSDFEIAHILMARVWETRGEYTKTIEHYQRALELHPQVAKVHNDMANTFKRMNRIDDCISHYQEAVKIDPDYAEAYNNLGVMLQSQGKFDQAASYYHQAIKANPEYEQSYNNLGNISSLRNKGDDAVKYYLKALEINPYYAEAHNNLGVVLFSLGKIDDACTHWQQALKIKPTIAKAYYNLGKVFQLKGKPDDAVSYFNQALKLDPDIAEAHSYLGSIYYGRGNYQQAIAHWKSAVDLQPDGVDVLNNLAWVLATCQDDKHRSPAQAVKFAQRACELTNYRFFQALDSLSAAYAATGDFSEAVKTAEKAAESAAQAGEKELVDNINKRLGLYKTGRAYIQR